VIERLTGVGGNNQTRGQTEAAKWRRNITLSLQVRIANCALSVRSQDLELCPISFWSLTFMNFQKVTNLNWKGVKFVPSNYVKYKVVRPLMVFRNFTSDTWSSNRVPLELVQNILLQLCEIYGNSCPAVASQISDPCRIAYTPLSPNVPILIKVIKGQITLRGKTFSNKGEREPPPNTIAVTVNNAWRCIHNSSPWPSYWIDSLQEFYLRYFIRSVILKQVMYVIVLNTAKSCCSVVLGW
jgi:hypothetical protein